MIEHRRPPAFLPMQTRNAPLAPASMNMEARTVDVVFTTGATVRRRRWVGWDSVPFDEELVVSKAAVDLARLNTGGPVLDSHSSWSTGSQVAVVDRAWIADGQGFAKVRFPSAGTDERADRMWGMVSQGIIRNVSVGYVIDQARVIEAEKKGDVERRIVERWTPYEISFVTIPADAGAQTRGSEETFPIVLEVEARSVHNNAAEAAVQENNEMSSDTVTGPNAVRQERERSATIADLAEKLGERDFGTEHIRAGTSVNDFRNALLARLADRSESVEIVSHFGVNQYEGEARSDRRSAAIENALLHRSDPHRFKLTEEGRGFRGMSLLDLGRDSLEAGGISTRGMSRLEIASSALQQRSGGMMSTSDFPVVLSNVLNKTLRAAYEAAPQTFRPLVRVTSVQDFKPVTRVQLGEAPQFDKVNEHGEFKRGSIGEASESYKVETFGKIVGITRQVIVNDDLDAFTRLPRMFGVQAAQLESDLVWSQILGNYVMGDGKTLFHADHGNLGTAGTISTATVGAGRTMMSKQTGLDSKTVLNIRPAYIIVPVALETSVEQFLGPIVPTKTSDAVPGTMRKLIPISDARLDSGIPRFGIAGSATNWFLAADNSLIDTIELAYLDGNEGVYTETRVGFDVDGVEVKVRMDVGAKAIDWRGLWKNPN